MQPITVLIADDNAAARGALAALLGMEAGVEVIAEAGDAVEATQAARLRPTVALVDVSMPEGGGFAAARGIRAASPETRIVALSAHDDRETVLEMIRAGASGYLVKGAANAEIVATVRAAADGRSSLSAEVATSVVRELAEHLEREGDEETRRQAATERIREVLRRGAIRPVYQPILDLRTGRTVGYEALSRFEIEPVRPPDQWFAEAADVGLAHELEVAALRRALEEARHLPSDVYISVNLSPNIFSALRSPVTLGRIPMRRTVVELTEHAPVVDYEAVNTAIGTMRGRGGRLAIDDTGAGFASLTHILRLSPDFIKLDLSLTRGIDHDEPRRALAKALISFASEIGASIVAEGIETANELEALRELDVAFGQGYYLGHPAPVGELPSSAALRSTG